MVMGDASLKGQMIGVAVILTNDYVGCPNCKELPGTKEDHRNWKTTLESLLFDVRSYTNLSKEKTIHLLDDVSALDMPATLDDVKQHLVFMYCGHGQKGHIVCQDSQRLSTHDVCKPFLEHRCGTDVTKLLFFDACHGDKLDKGRVYARSASVAEHGGELKPSEGNYPVVFSTLPGSLPKSAPPLLTPLSMGCGQSCLLQSWLIATCH